MGNNRRINLKKTLGLTEYPWSSDDEDDPPSTSEPVSTTSRRQADTTNSNLPGTSAQLDPAQNHRRRVRARVERDLYWSLLNNSPRPPSSGAAPGPSRPTSSSVEPTESIDLTSPMTNLERILAIKRLRNTPSSSRHCAHPTQRSASSSAASRQDSPLPTAMTTWAEQQANRRLYTRVERFKVLSTMRGNSSSRDADSSFYLHPPLVPTVRSPTRSPPRTPPRSPPQSPPHTLASDSAPSDDDLQPQAAATADPPDNNTADQNQNERRGFIRSLRPVLAQVLTDMARTPHGPNAQDGRTASAGSSAESRSANTAAARASDDAAQVVGDLMEIDVTEEENQPDDNVSNQAQASGDDDRNEETADVNAPASPRSPQAAKRKRVKVETVTAQDLNRSLLQLLECPVCLEWMDPPMSQCRRGHLVCVRCRARLTVCPVCRTAFSSMRNRAMEGVAEMLRYPCRHGCGRETHLRQRCVHEASCASRRYRCPAAACARREPLPLADLPHHFQTSHATILKVGSRHEFSMKMNLDQHNDWLLMVGPDLFYMRVDVNIRTWGIVVHVAYIGPKCNANSFTYEVSVMGLHKERRLVYTRETHSDLESASLNVSRQDCFHLTLDQALNFLRYKNRHCEPDKCLVFAVEIAKRAPHAPPAQSAQSAPPAPPAPPAPTPHDDINS